VKPDDVSKVVPICSDNYCSVSSQSKTDLERL